MRCYTVSYGLMREISRENLVRVQMDDLVLDPSLPNKFTRVNLDQNAKSLANPDSQEDHPDGHVLVLFIEYRRDVECGFFSDYTYELPPLKQIISRGISATGERAVLAVLRPGDVIREYVDARHSMDVQIDLEHGHLVKRFLPTR